MDPEKVTPALAALREWEGASTLSPQWVILHTSREHVEEPFRKYGQAFAVVLAFDTDHLIIERLHSRETGRGHSKALVCFLQSLADKHEVRIEVIPGAYELVERPIGPTLSDNELRGWYAKRGFVQKTWGLATMWYPDFPPEPQSPRP